MSHPLCERCLAEDIITPADDVHHIVSFMKAKDMLSMKGLAYNPENLQSLCRSCHQKLHR
jgi:5-methylcytosine-specific restriction protein A